MPVSGGGHRRYDPSRLKKIDLTHDEEDVKKHENGTETVKLLSTRDILDIGARLNGPSVPWAFIGGCAFKLHGLDYETADVDVSALDRIDDYGFQVYTGKGVGNDPNGHYLVNGVKVDWMYRLDDGSAELFRKAVENAKTIQGVPVAPVEYAMAIKVNAGRAKDVAAFYEFIRKDWVDSRAVLKLIDDYVVEVE